MHCNYRKDFEFIVDEEGIVVSWWYFSNIGILLSSPSFIVKNYEVEVECANINRIKNN